MSFLDHIRRANNWNRADFRPLLVAGQAIGHIRSDRVGRLGDFPDVFAVRPDHVSLAPGLDDFATRSAAIGEVLEALRMEGEFPGWRGELYPAMREWGDAPLFQIERAAAPWFGVRSWGVHVNGFVRLDDGLHMWVARRARDKPAYPGMLDNMVAGGQPIGMGLMENIVKECAEEADIPAKIAKTAWAAGAISYCHQFEDGVKPDQQFCYDLELPADFTPRNTDGEVEGFELWPMGRVMETVRETFEFKFNCNLVILDFLIRHGFIDADRDSADYLALCIGLKGGV